MNLVKFMNTFGNIAVEYSDDFILIEPDIKLKTTKNDNDENLTNTLKTIFNPNADAQLLKEKEFQKAKLYIVDDNVICDLYNKGTTIEHSIQLNSQPIPSKYDINDAFRDFSKFFIGENVFFNHTIDLEANTYLHLMDRDKKIVEPIAFQLYFNKIPKPNDFEIVMHLNRESLFHTKFISGLDRIRAKYIKIKCYVENMNKIVDFYAYSESGGSKLKVGTRVINYGELNLINNDMFDWIDFALRCCTIEEAKTMIDKTIERDQWQADYLPIEF